MILTPERLRVFNDWRRQPSTVAGISALLGALSALLAGQVTLTQAVPVIAGALAAMVLPDNANRQSSGLPAAVVAHAQDQSPPVPISPSS